MPAGIFFVVIGGWLLSRWTYSSSAFGLVNGRYVFWLRLNVTSRKLIICLLASMVMRSPLLLKMRHISFLMFSVSLGEALVMASPSSGYSPTFMLRCWSCERRKLPTSSHMSKCLCMCVIVEVIEMGSISVAIHLYLAKLSTNN